MKTCEGQYFPLIAILTYILSWIPYYCWWMGWYIFAVQRWGGVFDHSTEQ
jgi:hypothetical protein